MTLPSGQELLQLNRAGLTYSELAKRYGSTRGTVARAIANAKKGVRKTEAKFQRVRLGAPFALKGDAMIVGDVHVPTTDYQLARMVGTIAEKHLTAPRKLIIAGDMFNFDSFSVYAPVVRAPSMRDELEAARQLLHDWLDVFAEIYVIMGNHDRRLQKWSAAEFEAADIFSMITTDPRVKVSNYGWCTLDTPGGRYRITHSRNYSVNAGTVAGELANKYQCHIICHHQHHLCKTLDRWKRYICIDNGGLFDVEQLAYVVLDDSKSPGMAQGFTMLRDGSPTLFGKFPFEDWTRWV